MVVGKRLVFCGVPGGGRVEDLVRLFREELGLAPGRALEHASNVEAGSTASITVDDDGRLRRLRTSLERCGCSVVVEGAAGA